jgi:tRNA pseudouridine32 synthase / 23S rRNA pseudouridine746 synthase
MAATKWWTCKRPSRCADPMTTTHTFAAAVVEDAFHHAVWLKPAGMTVVAGRGVPRPTLLDVAVERFGEAKPVHRLDRVTTGLCIVAKSAFGQAALSDAFRRHLVDKRYLAIVEGLPTWDKLDVDARLTRVDDPDARKGPLAIQTIAEDGIRALTRLRVLARGTSSSLVEARPETGRMHQIRCHLAHVGHPIVGDKLYGSSSLFVVPEGVALFAAAVSFPQPSGGRSFCVLPHKPMLPLLAQALEAHGLPAQAVVDMLQRFARPPAPQPAPKSAPNPTTSKTTKPATKASAHRPMRPGAPQPAVRHTQRRRPPRGM